MRSLVYFIYDVVFKFCFGGGDLFLRRLLVYILEGTREQVTRELVTHELAL